MDALHELLILAVIELHGVTQIPNDYPRRWFTDDNFDLIVWYAPNGAVHGFQLCYDKTSREKALTWLRDRGFSHRTVKTGEESPLTNHSPILKSGNGNSEMARVLADFRAADQALPVKVRTLVKLRIKEYGTLETRLPEPWRPILFAAFIGAIALTAKAIYDSVTELDD